jgi:hypothetical protein
MKGVKELELYFTIRPSSQLQVTLETKEKTLGFPSISDTLSSEATTRQFRACKFSLQLGGSCLDRSWIATVVVLVIFLLLPGSTTENHLRE